MSKKVAVILAGCGHLDGAEIRESIITLLALEQKGFLVDIFAPHKKQTDVVNHSDQQQQREQRMIHHEAARIARGPVSDLVNCHAKDYDALVMPGGFGVAKSLSNFAEAGAQAEVDSELTRIIKDFYNAQKSIGAICIAPAIIARVLAQHQVEVTLGGKTQNMHEVIAMMGAKHRDCLADEICIDQTNKIVTTPAYMYDNAQLNEVYRGVSQLVEQISQWCHN